MVVAHEFVAFWKVNKIPHKAFLLHHKADVNTAPNKIGIENARKSALFKTEIKDSAFYWLDPKSLQGNIFETAKNLTTESFAIKDVLNSVKSDTIRVRITPLNFINIIEQLNPFFNNPIDAIHCFYAIVAYWDTTSVVTQRANGAVCVSGFKGQKGSDDIVIDTRKINEFKKFIEEPEVFTNGGSGLTVDYYFSRFDEAMAKINPEYIKQHGIFFTNDNLSKFALWFVKETFSGDIHEKYIVFDPAGGSGNLISSWRQKLKHKIISELEPDLLKVIAKRMEADPFHVSSGFTIVPKTVDNKGLNFLDRSAEDYLNELKKAVKESGNLNMDKPLAFLLNPPYKNTDENIKEREQARASYTTHPSIVALTGNDAGNERYLAFLGQILNISIEQVKEYPKIHPVVMIFTPTSWLIPRPTYVQFRNNWDKYFKYHSGFIVTSNQWFKLPAGQDWGVTFTIWTYEENEKGHSNKVKLLDLTHLQQKDLSLSWGNKEKELNKEVKKVLRGTKYIILDNSRGDIRKTLPLLKREDEWIQQPRYDFSTAKKDKDAGKIVSGFPLRDARNHFELKRKCGMSNGKFVGFMDNNTPVRLKQDSCNRMSTEPNRVWMQLRPVFTDLNLTKVQSGASDKYSYCAYDLPSAKAIFSWFAITKALNGVYPTWANQYDIWSPKIKRKFEKYWYSLCFAFVLAENRCVVTKFEEDNPVKGAPEVFVHNPLCPADKDSFWSRTVDRQIISKPFIAKDLVNKIKQLYNNWNQDYCKGNFIYNVGLKGEPYFKYFDYKDFLTPYSGLIQIRKYAEIDDDGKNKEDLRIQLAEISELTKKVKEEIYRLLVKEFKYFE